jgi:hypothetical protein
MRFSRTILPLIVGASLISACAGLIKSEVTVFHKLPDQPPSVSYIFVPLEAQKSSLEYETYQDLIRKQLAKHNFKEVTVDKTPDVIVAFGYGIDSGREKLASIPIYGKTGVSSSHTYGTLTTYGKSGTYSGTTTYRPSYGIIGTAPVSKTEYQRGMWLAVVDSKSVGTENLSVLYEGTVKSSGSSSQLSKVMPAMVEALFKEFPGKSGDTRTETGVVQ